MAGQQSLPRIPIVGALIFCEFLFLLTKIGVSSFLPTDLLTRDYNTRMGKKDKKKGKRYVSGYLICRVDSLNGGK
jgi:hypothetical protein